MSISGPGTDSHASVLLHNSHWASNIGNPFFTLGAKHVLDGIFRDAQVLQTDQLSAVCWTPSEKQFERDLKYVQYSEPDWFVLCGPMMSEGFVSTYETVFDRMDLGKTKIMLLSVGSIEYTQQEVNRCRKFLERYPPEVFFTRDEWTYEQYGDLAAHSYNGVDFALFTPDFYPGYPTPRLDPYVTFTFDKIREPKISISDVKKQLGIEVERVHHGRWIRWLMRHLPKSYPETVDNHLIIRPTHGVLNRSERNLYKKPNTFFSQTPYGYLNLYRNTQLTLSDRVHACVPTVAYGGAARLFTDSPRARLFERIGLEDITGKVCTVDLEYLREEKQSMINELSASTGRDTPTNLLSSSEEFT